MNYNNSKILTYIHTTLTFNLINFYPKIQFSCNDFLLVRASTHDYSSELFNTLDALKKSFLKYMNSLSLDSCTMGQYFKEPVNKTSHLIFEQRIIIANNFKCKDKTYTLQDIANAINKTKPCVYKQITNNGTLKPYSSRSKLKKNTPEYRKYNYSADQNLV